MKQYLELLQKIRSEGTKHEDRTGTGTTRIFGHQMRFDLSEGFPLLTTKKMWWKGIVEELLWMLSGSTNVKDLQDRGVTIWDEWATAEQCAKFEREEGDLGPVYGWAWRNFGAPYPVSAQQPIPELREGLERMYLGVGNGTGKRHHLLSKRWEGMMARCYDPKSISYPHYGAKGVYVCDRWLEFTAFAEDAPKLPGWDNLVSNVELDKDAMGTGHRYGPDDCRWVTRSENAALRDRRIFVLERGGREYRVSNISAFCEEQGIDARNMSDLWTGRKNAKTRYDFKLVRVEDPTKGVDQIANIVELLINNPNSRRIILSGWNPKEANEVALPPCHTLTQFSVINGKLSAQMYQRSADVFLGVPFNIASYALLTHMLAHVCKLEVGEFIHVFGDVHIYRNHEEQVSEQIRRIPKELPKLTIGCRNRTVTAEVDVASMVGVPVDDPRASMKPQVALAHLLDITRADMKLEGYDPHPAIKAEVSV